MNFEKESGYRGQLAIKYQMRLIILAILYIGSVQALLRPKRITFSRDLRSCSKCQASLSSVNDEEFQRLSNEEYASIASELFSGKDKRPIILFDGVCNLCNGGVNFALDNDETGNFRFASLQSRIGQALLVRAGKEPADISSIVLCEKNKTLFKSDAVLKIARSLDGPVPVLGYFGPIFPTFLRDIVYDFVADNRYRFGESDQCRLGDDRFDDRFVPDP